MTQKKKLTPIISCLLIGGLILFLLVKNGTIWFTNFQASKYPVRGIDVSHHQGKIDWQKVSENYISFAYIKATEADDFRDDLFDINWKEAQNANIYTGAYHFYSLAFPGDIQARNFIDTVPLEANQLPPAIDLEYVGNSKLRPAKEKLQEGLTKYIIAIENHYKKRPILYVTYEFYEDYLYPEFKNERIWIRDIFSKPNQNIGSWTIWQYNPIGKIKGVLGNVDLNVFAGTKTEFEKWTVN